MTHKESLKMAYNAGLRKVLGETPHDFTTWYWINDWRFDSVISVEDIHSAFTAGEARIEADELFNDWYERKFN